MNDNVSALPRYQVNDVVAALRQLANRIAVGELPATHVVVVRVSEEEEVDYHAFGSEPFARWQAAGALTAATYLVMHGGNDD